MQIGLSWGRPAPRPLPSRVPGRLPVNDFEQRIAAMSREQLSHTLLLVALAWDSNDFEKIGVVLEDNGLTVVE